MMFTKDELTILLAVIESGKYDGQVVGVIYHLKNKIKRIIMNPNPEETKVEGTDPAVAEVATETTGTETEAAAPAEEVAADPAA